MDKSERDFLLECQKELASIKEIIGALEDRIAAMQEKLDDKPESVPEETDEVDFTGVELGVDVIPADAVVPEAEPAGEPVQVEEPEPVVEVPEPVAVEEPEPVAEPVPQAAPAVPDETANMAWRKDNPGMLVKNIRSGISLLDRAQFIGTLFKEDFALYDNTLAQLNNMTSLDDAVAYIKANFPQWNLGSDVAYRFMMAIRKKLG